MDHQGEIFYQNLKVIHFFILANRIATRLATHNSVLQR